MAIASVNELVDALRQGRLLESSRLQVVEKELLARFPEPRGLATELVRRKWLTLFQGKQLLQGQELLRGSYVLLDLLGEGGMGQVFKARHQKLNRIVALKVIRKERLEHADAARRFLREIRAASKLSHPNIVLAYDADQDGDSLFFAMEHLDGIDLARLVKRDGPLPVAEACDCIRQAALGLQHAHENGLVHRDIKPSNLFLATKTSSAAADGLHALLAGATVKVLDMGLVRVENVPEEKSSSTMTHSGCVMGTPDYIAPEQARNSHSADIRADLYSLGCTLYFLLTGQVPFPGGTLTEKLMRHQMDEPTPVEQRRPDTPPAVAALVRKLMAKEPANRLETPEELALVLSGGPEGLQGLAVLASPTKESKGSASEAGWSGILTEEAPTRSRRRPSSPMGGYALAVAAVVIGVMVVGGVLLIKHWRGGGEAIEPSPPQLTNTPGPIAPAVKEVAIEKKNNDYHVRTRRYDAIVEADGCLTSLRLGGVEMLQPGLNISRGGYLHDGKGVLRLNVQQAGESAVTAKGERASIRYEFEPDQITFDVSNAADHRRVYFLVLSSAVTAVRNEEGEEARVPVKKDWPTVTWLAGDARWTIVGGSGIWGPWNGAQVWQTTLEAGASRKVVLSVGDAKREPLTPLPTPVVGPSGPPEIVFPRTPSPLDKLVPSAIDPSRRSAWQPKELAAVFGDHRWADVIQHAWGQVAGVAWSQDGKLLATAGQDGTVRLADAATGKERTILRGHKGGVHAVAISPDGKIVASGGTDDKAVMLWDIDGPVPLAAIKPRTLAGHTHAVRSVTFSSDGKTLASASQDGDVRLWDVASGKLLVIIKAHPGSIGAIDVAFSPDGRVIATGGGDHEIKLWFASTGKPKATIIGHKELVHAVAFAPDGKTLASGSWDQTVKIWDLPAGGVRGVLRYTLKHRLPLRSVAFSPDGKTLATGSGDHAKTYSPGEVRLWDVASGKERIVSNRPTALVVNAVAFSPDSLTLASVGHERYVKRWDVASGKELTPTVGHFTTVRGLSFASDGRTLASASWDGSTRLWDTTTGRERTVLTGLGRCHALAFPPDGRVLAIGAGEIGAPVDVKLIDAATGKELLALRGHAAGIHSVAFAPNGKILATGSVDHTIKLWDWSANVAQREPVSTFASHTEGVLAVAFSADGKLLASGGWDKAVKLWDVAAIGARLVQAPKQSLDHHHQTISAMAFAPSGRVLATGGGAIFLWDTTADIPRPRALPGLAGEIGTVTFSPDGQLVGAAATNGQVVLWHVESGAKVREWKAPGGAYSLAFAPDGRHLALGTTTGVIYILRLAST